jgi:hypothetical protein
VLYKSWFICYYATVRGALADVQDSAVLDSKKIFEMQGKKRVAKEKKSFLVDVLSYGKTAALASRENSKFCAIVTMVSC